MRQRVSLFSFQTQDFCFQFVTMHSFDLEVITGDTNNQTVLQRGECIGGAFFLLWQLKYLGLPHVAGKSTQKGQKLTFDVHHGGKFCRLEATRIIC